MSFLLAQEGLRFFLRALKVRAGGFYQHSGTAEQICKKIILQCYDTKKNFFRVSNGNFSEFYTRDFGWCVEPLLKLGYEKEVGDTLKYAFDVFQKNDGISSAISPKDKPFDFPTYAADSLPYLVRSLRIFYDHDKEKAKELIEKYEFFLFKETERFKQRVLDDNNLVKKNHFSSLKDHSVRQSSCYDNAMVGMLSEDLNNLKIYDPFKKINFKKMLMEHFWNGEYFLEDLSGSKIVSSDANIFPYWSGLIDNKKMLKKSIQKIQEENLDKPFPLKYSNEKKQKMVSYELFAKNYERNSVWMHIGPIYVGLVQKINKEKARFYINQYKSIIEKYGTYLEVFDSRGEPYKTLFYYTDEGMLWASMYLDLL